MKLADIKTEFEKYIIIKDEHILEVIMITLAGNLLINRDPIWTLIVGVSSGGKTTLISPCVAVPHLFFIDDLTEKTFLSGYKLRGKETSLLKIIGSGILAFSDFTAILAKNPVSRGEILSQLKLVYDGVFIKRTGIGGIEWRGKMGFIAGATPDIYQHLETGRSMGERFSYYWLEQPGDEEIAKKQAEINLSSKDITEKMKPLYLEYITGLRAYLEAKGTPPLVLSPVQRERIREAAIFCVNGKATVHTNFKTGKADSIPNKAGVGRDYKAFETILHTRQVMRAYETDDVGAAVLDEDIKLIQKLAYSSINRERRKVLEILSASEVPLTASEIGADGGLGLHKDSVEMYLIPLHAVGLIQKQTTGSSFKWFIDDKGSTRKFVNSVAGAVSDPLAPNRDIEDKPLGKDDYETI